MGLNDQLADKFIGHDVNLQRLQAEHRRILLKELKALESQIIAKLKNMAGESFTKARQTALLKQVQKTIQTGYRTIYQAHREAALAMATFDVQKIPTVVNGVVSVQMFTVGVPESVIASLLKDSVVLGAPLRKIWEQEAGALNQAFIAQMRQGILAGETTDQLIRRVRGTQAANFKDGIMNPRERAVEMRVRTSAQSILNDARWESYQANSDLIQGVQWQSVLDDRTSEICMALSGQTWDLSGNPLGDTDQPFPGPPPAHPNCRSTLVPILKSWEELTGIKGLDRAAKRELKDLPESKQASMDGQVAAKLTYEEWLGRKSQAFQEEVLGPGKYRLWKSGKISLKDLIDQRGNPLTLAQLQER